MPPIEVETGPMFSGKTSELITQAERFLVAEYVQGVDFLVFNHVTDKRYGDNVISTHGKNALPAIAATSSADIFSEIFNIEDKEINLKERREELSAIFIDEAQFFDDDLPTVLSFIDQFYKDNLHKNINIYVAGLDMDFRGEPFGPMPRILAIASKVNKFSAVCKQCNEDKPGVARYTQRLIDGKPANYSDPVVEVGAAERYTARCFKHHEVPGKPKPKT